MLAVTSGIVVLSLVIFNSIIPACGQSPCPSIFRLVNGKVAGEKMGRVEIRNAPKNVALHIRIEMSVAVLLPTEYLGDLDLATSQDEAVLAVQQGQPLFYDLRFPVQNPIPSITAITFNGQRYCTGPPATGSSVTSISLEHTLYPPGVNTLSSNIPATTTNDFANYPMTNINDYFNNFPSTNTDDFFSFRPSMNTDDFFSHRPSTTTDDFFSHRPSTTTNDFFSSRPSTFTNNFFNKRPSTNIKDYPFNLPVPSGMTDFMDVTLGSNLVPIAKPVTTVPISIKFKPSTERPQPVTRTERPRTIVPMDRPRPVVPAERPQPIITTERPQRIIPTERPQPIITTQRPQPIITTERPQPIITTKRPQPIITTKRPQPIITTERPQPITLTPAPTINPQNPFLNPPPVNIDRNCGRSGTVNHLIAYGESTLPGQWPWIAALFIARLEYEFLCGGSLLTERHVMTAAHCKVTDDGEIPASAFLVALGRYHLMDWREEGSMTYEVLDFRTHPGYTKNSADSDLALIILREKVEFSRIIQPLCLWSRSISLENVVGLNGYVVGWGRDENGNLHLHEPRLAQMPIVSQAICRHSHVAFTVSTSNRTFCAGGRNGSGPCNGDSGSALVIRDSVTGRYYLRGVVSLSPNNGDKPTCDLSQYVVFVDTAQYLDWIKIQISYS